MTIYEQICATVDSLGDRHPYESGGRVVLEPFGAEWPQPTYQSYSPSPMATLGTFGITREDLHFILMGMFFLIALALVTRK